MNVTSARKICVLVGKVEERGRSVGGTLTSISSDLLEDLKDAAVQLAHDFFRRPAELLDVLDRHRPQFWLQALVIHGWALRDFLTLQRSPESPERNACWTKLCNCVTVLPQLLHISGALFSPTKYSRRLFRAILRSDVLACYAAVFATIGQAPRSELDCCLSLCSWLSLAMSHVAHVAGGKATSEYDNPVLFAVTVAGMPLTPALYREWLLAMSSSHLLEHVAKAYMCLEASARTALAQGNCTVNLVRGKLIEIAAYLASVVNCALKPHITQPIFAFCPRPLAMLRADINPTIRNTIKPLRTLLSGTCLQFWIGKQLLEARVMFGDGTGPRHGLPSSVLLPAPLQFTTESNLVAAAPHVQQFMNTCITVWQVTVSGPHPPMPQLSLGRAIGADFGVVLSLPASLPYKAVDVYDMAFEAMYCVAQRLEEMEGAGVAQHNSLTNALRLLTRLVLELEPDESAQRLPALWRSVALMAPSLCTRILIFSQAIHKFIVTLFQGILATEAGMVARPGGASAGAGGRDPRPCLTTVRCALEARLLPALELSFRRVASQRPPAWCVCMSMLNVVLRTSGVWPAVLAHGSLREIASMIVTLEKVARSMHEAEAIRTGAAVAMMDKQAATFLGHLLGLMEQMDAVLLQPWNLPPGAKASKSSQPGGKGVPASSSGQGRRKGRVGGAGSRASGGASTSASASVVASAKRKLLELNNTLELNAANHITIEWLADAGGQPPPGSKHMEQQQRLAVFAIAHWLPLAMSGVTPLDMSQTAEMGRGIMRGALLAAMQCWRARDAAAAVEDAAAAAPNDDAQVTVHQHLRFMSWRDFLLVRLKVMDWLAHAFAVPDHTLRDMPYLVPGALGLLELLAVALPEDVAQTVALKITNPAAVLSTGKKAAAKAPADSGGASGGSPPRSGGSPGDGRAIVILEESFLLRYGCKALRVALRELQSNAPAAKAAAARGGSPSGVLTALPQLRALRTELCAKHDLKRLPVLPSPDEAEHAAVEAGVKQCGNPRCNVMDCAPQESEISWKLCGRCRAVYYCSGKCHAEHWNAAHKRECVKAPG